jgi:hypothetical protein
MKFAIQLLTACVFMLPLSATAATTSVNITYPAWTSYEAFSDPFPQFNPVLGTLTSYSLTVAATVTSPDTFNPEIVFKAPGTGDAILDLFASGTNGGSISGTGGISLSSALDAITGTGTVRFLAQDFSNRGGITSLSFTQDTLTYTYTPVLSVVPEPNSIALIGAGFGMLSLVRRKRT